VRDYWLEYLTENPDLSETDFKIQVIKDLTPKQRISISARLEKAEKKS